MPLIYSPETDEVFDDLQDTTVQDDVSLPERPQRQIFVKQPTIFVKQPKKRQLPMVTENGKKRRMTQTEFDTIDKMSQVGGALQELDKASLGPQIRAVAKQAETEQLEKFGRRILRQPEPRPSTGDFVPFSKRRRLATEEESGFYNPRTGEKEIDLTRPTGPPALERPGFARDITSRVVRPLASMIPQAAEGLGELADLATSIGLTDEEAKEGRLTPYIKRVTEPLQSFVRGSMPTDPGRDKDFISEVAGAFGSAGGFAAGGLGAKALRLPSLVSTALLGAGVSISETLEEADKMGISPDRRNAALLMAAGAGLTEMVGLGRTLQKFGLSRPFYQRLFEVAEEGGQEAVQQWLGNVNAAYVGAYDPKRKLSEGVAKSFLLGAIVGGGFQGLSLGAEKLGQAIDRRDARREQFRQLGGLPDMPTRQSTTLRAKLPADAIPDWASAKLSEWFGKPIDEVKQSMNLTTPEDVVELANAVLPPGWDENKITPFMAVQTPFTEATPQVDTIDEAMKVLTSAFQMDEAGVQKNWGYTTPADYITLANSVLDGELGEGPKTLGIQAYDTLTIPDIDQSLADFIMAPDEFMKLDFMDDFILPGETAKPKTLMKDAGWAEAPFEMDYVFDSEATFEGILNTIENISNLPLTSTVGTGLKTGAEMYSILLDHYNGDNNLVEAALKKAGYTGIVNIGGKSGVDFAIGGNAVAYNNAVADLVGKYFSGLVPSTAKELQDYALKLSLGSVVTGEFQLTPAEQQLLDNYFEGTEVTTPAATPTINTDPELKKVFDIVRRWIGIADGDYTTADLIPWAQQTLLGQEGAKFSSLLPSDIKVLEDFVKAYSPTTPDVSQLGEDVINYSGAIFSANLADIVYQLTGKVSNSGKELATNILDLLKSPTAADISATTSTRLFEYLKRNGTVRPVYQPAGSAEAKSKAAFIREFLPRRETLSGLFPQFFGGKVVKQQLEQASKEWAIDLYQKLQKGIRNWRASEIAKIDAKGPSLYNKFVKDGIPLDTAVQAVTNKAFSKIPYYATRQTLYEKTFPEYEVITKGPHDYRQIKITERKTGEVVYEIDGLDLVGMNLNDNYVGGIPKEGAYKLATHAYNNYPLSDVDRTSLTWLNREDYLDWRKTWEMAIDRRAQHSVAYTIEQDVREVEKQATKHEQSLFRKIEKMRREWLKRQPRPEPTKGIVSKISKSPQGLVMHNIQDYKLNMILDNAQNSLDIAGQPMPSIAIVHPESVFNSFGDITLIGTPETIKPNPQQIYTDIFPTDFYTPTVSEAIADVVGYNKPLTPDLYQKLVDRMKQQSASAIAGRIETPGDVFSNAALFNSYSKAGGSYPTFEAVKKGLADLKLGAETDSAIPEFEETRNSQYEMKLGHDNFRDVLQETVDRETAGISSSQGRRNVMHDLDKMLLASLAQETFPSKASLINSGSRILMTQFANKKIYDDPEVVNALEQYMTSALAAFNAFRKSPLIYMEAQPQRVVGLGEYVAALVPTGKDDVTKRLEDLGIRVYHYSGNDDKVAIQRSLAQFKDLTVDPDSGYGALYNKIFESPEERQQRGRVESATMKRWGVPGWSPFSDIPAASQVQNARYEFRRYKRTGRIYTNNIGLMLLGLVDSNATGVAPTGTLADTVESEGALGGMAFQYGDVMKALTFLNQLNDNSVPTEVIDSLKQTLQDALQGMRETGTWSVTAATVEPSAIMDLRQTLRHEGIHQAQYKIDETIKNVVDYDWFASTELGQKAISGLAHYKVPDSMLHVYPMEAMAHLGAGQHGKIGLTAEEGARLLSDMLHNIAEKHGIEQLRNIPFDPVIKERLDDIARTTEQNAEGYAYTIRPTGRGRGLLERIGQWFRPQRGSEAGVSTSLRSFENIDTSTRPPGKFEQLRTTLSGNGLPFEFTWLDKLKRLGLDEAHPVLKAWHFMKTGHEMPSENAEYLMRLWLGTSGKVDRVFSEGMVDAQNQIATPGGLDWLLGVWDGMPRTQVESEMSAAISMMVAERTIELATKQWANPASGRAIDDVITGVADAATLTAAGGNPFLADVTASISELRRLQTIDPTVRARLEEAGARYRQWARALLDYAHDKGRMSDSRYNEMVSNGDFYVDLHRILDDDPDAILDSTPTKYGKVKRIMQKLTGSERRISNPYLNLMIQTEQVIKETDRNSAMNAFVEPLRTPQTNPQMQALYDSLGERIPRATRESVRVFNNGTEEHWDFHPEIEAALKGYGDIPSNMITNFLGFPFKVLRTMITHTPGFLVRNFLRDAQQRTLLSRTNETARAILNPLEGSKPWDAITTLFKPLSKADRNSFWLTGASQAGYYASSRIDWQSRLNDAMNDVRSDRRLLVVYPKALFRLLAKDIPTGLENVNRQAEFKAAKDEALKQGMSQYDADIKAAFESRDLMDFAVSGTAVKQLNKFVLFLNPAIQGLKRTQKAIKERPLPFLFRWSIYALLPALGELWWNYGQGDDELKEWQQLPAWRKDLFYNLKVGDDKWITIPKPFELGVAASLTNRLIDYSMLGNTNAFEDSGKSIWKSLIPVDDASKLIGPFISVAEAKSNWSYFYDEHIIPPGDEKRDVDYAKRRGSFIGQQLSKIFDQDPRIIDYYLRANLSDWATIANYTGELFNAELTPKEKEANSKKLLTLMTGNVIRPSKPDQAVNVKSVMRTASETFGERSDWYEPLKDAINDYRDETEPSKRQSATMQALAYADRVRTFVPKLKADLDGSMGKLDKLEQTNAAYRVLDKRTKDVVDSKLRSDLRAFDHEIMAARVKGDKIAEAEAIINKKSFNLSLALTQEILNYKLEQQEKGIERKVSPPMPRR